MITEIITTKFAEIIITKIKLAESLKEFKMTKVTKITMITKIIQIKSLK